MKRLPTRCAAPLLLLGAGACGHDTQDRPNIVLVTLDTTRADHLSCYGYEKPTSPRIDQLAQDGVLYENAYSVTSWTLPSHASIFTGRFPSSHGAMYAPDGKINLKMGIEGNPSWENYRANPLADDQVTLAQILRDAGYATGGVVAGPWLKGVFGLGRGFDLYDDENFIDLGRGIGELNGRTAQDVTRVAKRFVDEHADEPFFLFLNYYDPHAPYIPQPDTMGLFWQDEIPDLKAPPWEWTLAAYDSEIRYTDHHFGELLDHLRRKELYEDTWILVTADHGELMGEHGMSGHGNSLSQEEIRIPLIVKEPGFHRPRGRDARPVGQVDVLPTILTRLGLDLPPHTQGRPLDGDGHTVIGEVYPLPMMNANPNLPDRQLGDWQVLVDGGYKFVWGSRGKHYLFDLGEDPHERRNLVLDRPDVALRMERELKGYLASLPAPGAASDVELTPEQQRELERQLEATGYIGREDEGN